MTRRGSEYLSEAVTYGGLIMARGDVERHQYPTVVTGPARLAGGRLPALKARVVTHGERLCATWRDGARPGE